MAAGEGQLRGSASLVTDVLATVASFVVAFYIRHPGGIWEEAKDEYALALAGIVGVWVVVLSVMGCYRLDRMRPGQSVGRLLRALMVAHLCLALAVFYLKLRSLSRSVMVIFFLLNLPSLVVGRALVDWLLDSPYRPRLLVAGCGAAARDVAAALEAEGSEVVGHLAEPGLEPAPGARPVLGGLAGLREVIEARSPIDAVVVVLRAEDRPQARELARECEARGLSVREVIEPLGGCQDRIWVDQVGRFQVLAAHPSPAGAPELLIKRLVDIGGSLVGLAFTTVAFPWIALAIKLGSPGPVFYRQQRAGLNGRVFTLYKFRTMVDAAHDLQPELRARNQALGPHFKIADDPRITPIGRFLRRTSLDELPQFWNVLRADMSLVGPRPFDVREVARYPWHYHRRLSVKPGLTGLWQTRGRSTVRDFEQILRHDDEYIRNWSLWLDFEILLRTVPVVLSGVGAS